MPNADTLIALPDPLQVRLQDPVQRHIQVVFAGEAG